MKTFPARFFSRCAHPDCHDPIREGHQIQYGPNGTGVIHAHHDQTAAERPPRPACPWCHIELPATGACCA